MVTNICLISGICVSNYNLIYPTLVWIPTNFLIEIFSFFVSYLLDYARIDLAFLVNFLIEVTISILCWLCVHSLWQQVIGKFGLLDFVINYFMWESSQYTGPISVGWKVTQKNVWVPDWPPLMIEKKSKCLAILIRKRFVQRMIRMFHYICPETKDTLNCCLFKWCQKKRFFPELIFKEKIELYVWGSTPFCSHPLALCTPQSWSHLN